MRVSFNAFAGIFVVAPHSFGLQRLMQNVVQQRGLAGAGDSGDGNGHSQRDHQVDVLQVVGAGTVDAQKLAVRLVAEGGNGDAQLAVQVARGQRPRVAQQLLAGPGKQDAATLLAGAGAQVDHVVCGGNRVRIVFHHQDGVAQVSQGLQDVNQAVGVARMQPDGRLIEHVERPHQMRAERSGQLNALRLAARKRRGQPVPRQVLQPYGIEKAQALLDFLQNFFSDPGLLVIQPQPVADSARPGHGHRAGLSDRLALNPHRARFFAQAAAATFRAGGVAAIAAQEDTHVQFVLFALEPVEESLYAGEARRGIALEDHGALLRGKLAKGSVERNSVGSRVALHLLHERPVARLGPRLDGALVERFATVRNHQVEIEINRIAEALAARAGAVRAVEREQARLRLLIDQGAILALKALVEYQALRTAALAAGLIGHKLEDGLALSFAVANLNGVHQARA